ncbi:MAG: hypothetical protein RLN75_03885 [Longimicrobiales bacterium]
MSPTSRPPPPMDLRDVQAVIASARARGTDPLERWIRRRLKDPDDAEVKEASEVALEIIETVPIFLARAAQEAEERKLVPVVQPLLDRAVVYFTRPVDLIPEMTHGLAGLLDDTYLVLRILENLERGPTPVLDWDLEYPLTFLRGLVGASVARQLDELSILAMQDVSHHLSAFWNHLGAEA